MMSNPIPTAHGGRDQRLLALAREAALPVLGKTFASVVARFDDVLFDRAESAGASQLLFLDGMRELRRRREEISTRFRSHLELAWGGLEAGTLVSAEKSLSGQVEGSGLSLVPEHVL